MAKKESIQKRLQKVRPPRVQMTYDVEIGDGVEQKELPFVLGVVGDFAGNAGTQATKLKERNFVSIDNDNFDEVMKGVAPTVSCRVKSHLTQQEGEFSVDLAFRSINDFRPESVVNQVAPLKRLLEARSKLADLRNKLAGNEKLEDILNDVLSSTEKLGALNSETGHKGE